MHPGTLSLTAATLLLTLPALAQPPAPDSSTTTIKVFSRETIVDVIVTDAKGNAIRGLKQSDFTIQEDGNPQPIRGFGEFDRSFEYDPASANSDSPVHSNAHSALTSGPVNVLLIDGLHMNFVASNRALSAVSAYASRMPPGTQLAIFWLGVSGLHLLQGFTADPSAVQQAVSVPRTDIGSNLDCYQTDRLTINALNQIATYVAPIKGRKNLMWLSSGVPVYLLRDGGYSWGTATACHDAVLEPRQFGVDRSDGPSLFTGPDGIQTDGLDMTQVHRLMDTYELFTEEQVAVSPMDPGGLQAGPQGAGGMLLVAEQVAEQSGGIATFNTNDIVGRIAQTIDLGSHYYSVSYVPPRRKDDGHYHTITVHVDQPGLKLIYRKGYNSEDPRQPQQFAGPDLIKAALQGRAPAATQLIFDARLTPPPPAGAAPAPTPTPAPAIDSQSIDTFADPTQPAARPQPQPQVPPQPAPIAPPKGKHSPAVRQPYDLLLALPQNQITYGTAPGGVHTVKLQFAFDAYDLNGKLLGAHAQNVSLTLTPDRYAQFITSPVVFHEQIDFLPGPLFLRIGVLDNNSNKVGTIEIPLTIPKR
jgi:VWFA-related protein